MSFRYRLVVRLLAGLALFAAVLGGAALSSRPARADIIITAGSDKKVKLWSTDGTLIKSIDNAHTGAVTVVAPSYDGKLLATGGDDKKVKLWNRADGTLVKSIDNAHDGTVTALAFSPDGKQLYSGGADKKVKIWSVPDGKPVQTIDAHDGPVVGIIALPASYISGGADGTVKIWGDNQFSFPTGHEGGLTCMAGDSVKQMLYTAGADGKIKYWSNEPSTGEFEGSQGSAIKALVVQGDGKRLISGGADGKVKVWDADAHKLISTIDTANAGGANAVAVFPDGNILLAGGAGGKITAWNAAGNQLKSVNAHDGAVTVILYVKDKPAAPEKPEKKEAGK